jgi:hypothetical protein
MSKKLSKKQIARLDKEALEHQKKCLKPILKKHKKVLGILKDLNLRLEKMLEEEK